MATNKSKCQKRERYINVMNVLPEKIINVFVRNRENDFVIVNVCRKEY